MESIVPQPSRFRAGSAHRVTIACTFDPLGLQGPLQVWLRRLTGQCCVLSWVGYGMVLEVLRDKQSTWNCNREAPSDLNVLILRWQDLSRACVGEADPAGAVIAAVRASSTVRRGATLVLLPPTSDEPPPCEQKAAWIVQLRGIAGVHVLDDAVLRAAFGSTLRFHSPFLDRVAHAPYSPVGCSAVAGLICRELARVAAPCRKVFCLDCDNTIWGGAVSEVGPHGVALTEAFLGVQRRFVDRQARGALLCLVSRNHEEDVRAVLRARREELVLRDEHVVAIRASPQIRKSEAVLELASTLCLAPSAFVFVDDSPVECADVAAHAADRGVAVVHVPHQPSEIGAYLDACWALDEESSGGPQGVPTAEDLSRTILYRELDARKSFVSTSAASASSMDAFAASLNLRVDFAPVDASNAARAAQLTDRTNQHNACKRPISNEQLLRLSTEHIAVAADARDRFGHHGLVGLIVADAAPVEVEGAHAVAFSEAIAAMDGRPQGVPPHSTLASASPGSMLLVRCWLLSCRSLHLGIEHIMLRHVAAIATDKGATHIGVHWQRAERNEPAAAFLFSLGGVRFVTVDDAGSLGLQPLEEAAYAKAAGSAQGAVPASDPGLTPVPPTQDAAGTNLANVLEAAPAAELAVRHAIESGCHLSLTSLPPPEAFACMVAGARKKLVRRLASLIAKARHGELSSATTRAEAGRLIRGRVGGELCRHAVAGGSCPHIDCPFVHKTPRDVADCAPTVRLRLSLVQGPSTGQPIAVALKVGGAVAAAAARAGTLLPSAAHSAQTVVTSAPVEPSGTLAAASKARDPTYGQISQYRRDAERPPAGIIVIPVESAAAAAVSFDPAASKKNGLAKSASSTGGTLSEPESGGSPSDLAAYEGGSGSALHHETLHTLAHALSCNPEGLHEWVAAESDRTHQLPDAFREVWTQYEHHEAHEQRRQLHEPGVDADRHGGGQKTPGTRDGSGADAVTASTTPNYGADEDPTDIEALHARLRRRMRHSMHVMMQQANPDSYYKNVEHPDQV